MKILYVATQDNPLDPAAGSGADYEYYHAFTRNGADVQIIGPFPDRPSPLERAYRRAHRLFSRRRFAKRSMAAMNQITRAVHLATAVQKPDVIFSISTTALAYCSAAVPMVSRLDTSLKGLQDQYPTFSEVEYRRMMGWEEKALRKVSLVITYSEWNAGILTHDYHVPPSRIMVIPVPASLPEQVAPRAVRIVPSDMKPLRLLLVGRDYARKGIDLALETVELLNAEGLPAELHIVGLSGKDTGYVQHMGIFRKDVDSDLRAYAEQFRWAHVLLHPARFEAGGIAISEAAAFGLPAITNAAGGLATTVRHGVSGIVLPAGSPAGAYVKAIRTLVEDPDAYRALRQSTRERYEAELDWRVVGRKVFQAIEAIGL